MNFIKECGPNAGNTTEECITYTGLKMPDGSDMGEGCACFKQENQEITKLKQVVAPLIMPIILFSEIDN